MSVPVGILAPTWGEDSDRALFGSLLVKTMSCRRLCQRCFDVVSSFPLVTAGRERAPSRTFIGRFFHMCRCVAQGGDVIIAAIAKKEDEFASAAICRGDPMSFTSKSMRCSCGVL